MDIQAIEGIGRGTQYDAVLDGYRLYACETRLVFFTTGQGGLPKTPSVMYIEALHTIADRQDDLVFIDGRMTVIIGRIPDRIGYPCDHSFLPVIGK